MDELQQLTQLRKTISEQFSKEELSLLCSDLGMKYENLPSSTIDGQARDLVVWMKRLGLWSCVCIRRDKTQCETKCCLTALTSMFYTRYFAFVIYFQ